MRPISLNLKYLFLISSVLLKYWDDSVIQVTCYGQHEKGLILVKDTISTIHRCTLLLALSLRDRRT